MRTLRVVDLGTMPYGQALALQREAAHARIDGRLEEDLLLLVEHPPVVTLGRGARAANLLASQQWLAARGVEVFEVERGGDVTLHAPGQLVGYPILDLGGYRRDLHWYLRQLEEALIRTLSVFGLPAERQTGYTGVWTPGVGETLHAPGSLHRAAGQSPRSVEEGADGAGVSDERAARRKIASIGVHVKQWVTWHGFALNVNTDLSLFDLIVPCGIAGVQMTSLARELRQRVSPTHVASEVVTAFGEVFGTAPVPGSPVALRAHAVPGA